MSKNRYIEKTEHKNPLGLPFSKDYKTTVKDNETGNKGEAWDKSEKGSRDKAYKDLREKQGE